MVNGGGIVDFSGSWLEHQRRWLWAPSGPATRPGCLEAPGGTRRTLRRRMSRARHCQGRKGGDCGHAAARNRSRRRARSAVRGHGRPSTPRRPARTRRRWPWQWPQPRRRRAAR
eukprot:scaffold39126_cov66-Phaeocystis_antarctica.AAC.1